MTVCKTCNGLGKIKLMPFGYICTCAECKGTGETGDYMTNEEWIKSCNTEQLAEILVYMAEDKSETKTVHKENVGKCVWWLKQPHTFK